MNTLRKIRVGTRRSRLALAQTNIVAAALRRACPGREFEIVGMATTGDRMSASGEQTPPGKGVFTKEIEQALLEGEIDMAVHSMKDLPTDLPDGLRVGAVPLRAAPNDALVSRDGAALAMLEAGAVVGTGSPRRTAQILAARPDLAVSDIRGNVETRLRKLDEGRYDAIVLACAGLARLGLTGRIAEALPVDVMIPAVGQGALAVEIRGDDAEMEELLGGMHDDASANCVAAERSLLRALGGGCRMPVAALAEVQQDGDIRLRAMVGSVDGKTIYRTACAGPAPAAERLGRKAAETLLAQGGRELLDNEA